MDQPQPPIREASVPQLDLTCPFCQVRLTVPPSQAGETAACPKCGGKFQVPLPTAQHSVGTGQRHSASLNPEVESFVNKKLAVGIIGILLGGLGIHKFILGFNTSGVIMLVVSVVGFITGMCLLFPLLATVAMSVVGVVEGVLYLTKSDEEFYQTYAIDKKEWF